ncbi:hypothetical protein A8W25_23770 [Streptomyces sp. ERV7]|uniref:hypothetical protein n=1 Tax=Streptomyces sp. ERV7 TaxID=1322334 RepID=UPI0007F357CC|nr:hypothetical protein [Streptomyces sp. ERV7]OAR22629.1 hypothetical protein A8W25_23770 [Streptomyces sp. ERV7]
MKPLAQEDRFPAEDRVRAALAARASLVTHHDLSHEAPPQGRSWGVRRVRRVALAALGAAAAVVAVCLLVLPGGPAAPAPTPPARPGVSEQPPSTAPAPGICPPSPGWTG